jgi:hypothetical protein
VERYLLYKRNFSEVWLVHDPELHIEVYLKIRYLTCTMLRYIFINEFKCK